MRVAVAAHRALGCRGVSRADFRYDDTAGEPGRAGAAGGQHPARHDPHLAGAGAGRASRHRLPRSLRLDGGAGPPWPVAPSAAPARPRADLAAPVAAAALAPPPPRPGRGRAALALLGTVAARRPGVRRDLRRRRRRRRRHARPRRGRFASLGDGIAGIGARAGLTRARGRARRQPQHAARAGACRRWRCAAATRRSASRRRRRGSGWRSHLLDRARPCRAPPARHHPRRGRGAHALRRLAARQPLLGHRPQGPRAHHGERRRLRPPAAGGGRGRRARRGADGRPAARALPRWSSASRRWSASASGAGTCGSATAPTCCCPKATRRRRSTRLAELQASNALLDRPLTAIDMRQPDKLVLRSPPTPAAPPPTPPDPASVQRARSGGGRG